MIIPAGRRDTEITFQRRTSTQSSTTGARTYTWANVTPTEWAEVLDILPSRAEQISEGIDIAKRPCRIRCNYRSDITPDMRVTFDGRTLEIVSGPAEIGRKQGLEMIAQEVSTQGGAA